MNEPHASAGLLSPYGVHHVALNVLDMKSTLEFFNEVLGMELVMLYWMHGAKDTVHAFLRINDHALLGLVTGPNMPEEIELGTTHPGNPEGLSVGGTMHSLCLEVHSEEDLIALRSRVRSKGIHCFGPSVERGPSIVLAGPDGMLLRVVVKRGDGAKSPMNLQAAAAAGLTEADLETLARPEAFIRPATPVGNPRFGEDSGLRMFLPERQLRLMAALPDEWVYDALSMPTPPTEKAPILQPKRWSALAKIAFLAILGPLTGRV